MRHGAAAWLLALACGAALAEPAVLQVGPAREIRRIADAARLAGDDAIVEIDPGEYVADVAVWDRARLVLRAAPGGRVRLVAGGAAAEGKGIWVVRRGEVTIEGIDFVGAKVPERNGAGIRFESGRLTVRDCGFYDNEDGILTAHAEDAELAVENSRFERNGAGDGFSHAIYVGGIAGFRLAGSTLTEGREGHLVKSRARRNRIEGNRIADEAGHASYELEFPNGGEAEVVGNLIQQGTGTRNPVIVSYGAEGWRWPRNVLRMQRNTVVDDLAQGGVFVRTAAGADAVVLRDNLFVGAGRIEVAGPMDERGSRHAARVGDTLPALPQRP